MTTATHRNGRPTRTNMTTARNRAPSLAAAALAALAFCGAAPARAQSDYPSKPIKIVVPYAAGGGADIVARLIGQQLGERLKQPVIVENRGGGRNTVGM